MTTELPLLHAAPPAGTASLATRSHGKPIADSGILLLSVEQNKKLVAIEDTGLYKVALSA